MCNYENANTSDVIISSEEKNTNNKLTQIKNFTKAFWNNNKNKILFVGGCGLVIAGTALAIDNVHQREYVKSLSEKVFNQKNKIKYLYKQNNIKNKRIETLKNMCIKKDNFFKKFISDGTRRGDPECARQLAYRKQYIKEIS